MSTKTEQHHPKKKLINFYDLWECFHLWIYKLNYTGTQSLGRTFLCTKPNLVMLPWRHRKLSYHVKLPWRHRKLSYHVMLPWRHRKLFYHVKLPRRHRKLFYHVIAPWCHRKLVYHLMVPWRHHKLSYHVMYRDITQAVISRDGTVTSSQAVVSRDCTLTSSPAVKLRDCMTSNIISSCLITNLLSIYYLLGFIVFSSTF